jgi:thymidylate kinase
MKKLTIAIEGLMSTGKSSLIRHVCLLHSEVTPIPEIVPNQNLSFTSEYDFVQNDIEKSCVAKSLSEGIVLLDRYYISTLIYGLSRYAPSRWSKELMGRLIERYYPKKLEPDIWVYLHESPELSWERSIAKRPERLTGLWGDYKAVQRMAILYDRVFDEYFPAVGARVVTVKSQDVKQMKEIINEEIKNQNIIAGNQDYFKL